MISNNAPHMLCDGLTLESITQAVAHDEASALRQIDAALAQYPGDARLWLLRGSIHATQGNHVFARVDFEQALRHDAGLHIARFMLGMLELFQARPSEAAMIWEPLDQLPPVDPLRLFKQGLVLLSQDQFDLALDELNQGLSLNTQYPHINTYVSAVVGQIHTLKSAGGTAHQEVGRADSHLLLSDYLGSNTRH